MRGSWMSKRAYITPSLREIASYDRNIADYERLKSAVASLISAGLEFRSIEFLRIQARVKERQSLLKKLREKEYKNGIADVTDIVGIRIILYLEKDISQVDDLLREMFWVDEKNSDDKLDSRSVDTVGYRSLHLICSLGNDLLPENWSI